MIKTAAAVIAGAVLGLTPPSDQPTGPVQRYEPRVYDLTIDCVVNKRGTLRDHDPYAGIQLGSIIMPVILSSTYSEVDRSLVTGTLFYTAGVTEEITGPRRTASGWLYAAQARDCQACALRARCVPPTARRRTVLVVEHYPALLRARRRRVRRDARWRHFCRRHRAIVEGVHGEGKSQHGLRRAARRQR